MRSAKKLHKPHSTMYVVDTVQDLAVKKEEVVETKMELKGE